MSAYLTIPSTFPLPQFFNTYRTRRKGFGFKCRSSLDGEEDYLIDAPVQIGDGFSFSGGKYSDGKSPSDEWFDQGRMIKAHPVFSNKGKAKDPFFGLTMGASSQSSADLFR